LPTQVIVLVYTTEYVVCSLDKSDSWQKLVIVGDGGDDVTRGSADGPKDSDSSLPFVPTPRSMVVEVLVFMSVVIIFGGGPRGGVGTTRAGVAVGVSAGIVSSSSCAFTDAPGAGLVGSREGGFFEPLIGATDLAEGETDRVGAFISVTSDPLAPNSPG